MLPSFDSVSFFNDTSTPEIYTLSLHDALPISRVRAGHRAAAERRGNRGPGAGWRDPRLLFLSAGPDRKSTRLNSSHMSISYAVFCLKKKKKQNEKQSVT